MRKTLYLLVLALICTLPAFAQTNKKGEYLVKGQVIDSLTNETVPYATLKITLSNNPANTVKLLACDIDGKFETDLKDPGEYVLNIQSVGKAPAQKSFSLSESKKTADLGKVFISEDVNRLEQVTITAQKPLVKMEIDKLTYNMEEDPEAQVNNTLDMLRKVPLITINGDDEIELKGSTNFIIHLNGKPSNMLTGKNASDILKSMPASNIKNIEVITEPGAKYDAEGIGGIINIITAKAIQGITGSVRVGGSVEGRYNGGGNITTKIGKWGLNANYNYSKWNNPWNNTESNRTFLGEDPVTTRQTSRSKYHNDYNYGNMEISYEIDSLNLLSIGASIMGGSGVSKMHGRVEDINKAGDVIRHYEQATENKFSWGAYEANIDFQHSTKKKDELLTISYRFSHRPDPSENLIRITDTYNYQGYQLRSKNDAHNNEHTAQIDYTTPLPKNQTIEGGIKYILRQNVSTVDPWILYDTTDIWVIDQYRYFDGYKNTQHIYGAYLSYNLKYKKIGFKTGVRAEGTMMKSEYNEEKEKDMKNDFFNFVPNATFSYQIGMTQTLRFGYNMRVSRPSIWNLNPYINSWDPRQLSYGNPNLKTAISHSLNLNYGMFTQKFNLNASANYSFSNNSITHYTFSVGDGDNKVTHSTSDNIGKDKYLNFHIYGRWAPIPLINMYTNAGLMYADYRTKASDNDILDNLNRKTLRGNISGGMQFNLPKDYRIDLNGGFYSKYKGLQYTGSNGYHYSIGINKSFLDKKLNVGINCSSPFEKNRKQTSITDTRDIYSIGTSYYRARDIRLSVSYRFGSMKESIKKVRRGITNDDTNGGGGGQGGGQGGGGGQ